MIEILFPKHGMVLTRHDGQEDAAGLTIQVQGRTDQSTPVFVNGVEAKVEGRSFSLPLRITARTTTLSVRSEDHEQRIVVRWVRGSDKRFRFSVDDNIEFLKDLGLHAEQYPSLFDHWYLAFWREMHAIYDTRVHLNIYYQTDGFDLTQLSSRWKAEWEANADWLHLSFHAFQDKPDRPYRNARYPQIAHDFDLVCGHIRRFAGNTVLNNTTTTHWAECPKEAVRALRDRGIENLIALFDCQGYSGPCTTGYYLDEAACREADTRGATYDPDTDLNFIRCTSVVNSVKLKDIPRVLNQRTQTPHTAEMVELLIHEQYFRKELTYYQPDVMDKVRAALDWVSERNYRPAFWSDGFLGIADRQGEV